MTVLVKAVKPQRLKVDAMRLALLNEMRAVGRDVKKDFEATTRTWKGEKPTFEVDVSLQQPGPTLFVGPADDGSKGAQKYEWVDQGTRPHPIFAGIYTGKSKKRALKFKAAFVPKTFPGILGSGPGASGGATVVRPYVQHPGTAPRKFDETIARKWTRLFKRRMEAAMRKAAQASGHSIK